MSTNHVDSADYIISKEQYHKLRVIAADIRSTDIKSIRIQSAALDQRIQSAALDQFINTLMPFDENKVIVDRKTFTARQEFTGDPDLDEMLRECIKVTGTKGAEYTGGSPDRLNNFRQAAADIGIEMQQVWYVFFNKHLRAVQSYIKNGCKVKSNEPISSRIMDCIVYLMLFHKMSKEIESKRAAAVQPIAHHSV